VRRAALVGLASVAAYLPSFGGAFQFDDYNVIVHYPTVHSWDLLFERAGAGVRALLKASYTLNWTLGGGSTFGFHVVNVVLHALNAVLLLFIGRKVFPDHANASLAAALLFALHPAQTEAVTYISGRSVSLMAAFYLGSILLYLRRSRFSVVLFILALAIKETAVSLPVALILIELVRREREPWRAVLRRQAPHWTVLGAGALVILLVPRYFELLAYGFSQRGPLENLLAQVGGISYLLARLVTLQGYNIDPGLAPFQGFTAIFLLQAAPILGLLALGLSTLRTRPWLGFGILWFFLQLAPTNSIVPRLDVANDRQLYLACWGLFLSLSIQISRLGFSPRIPAALTAAAAVAFAAASITRQLDYRNEITLWEASVRENPANPRARNNLGYAYYLAGRKPEARREIEAAVGLDPSYGKARANLLLLDWR
jgi:tetratricopeptide (TPR) repeat protein